jgi:hypothetical protein
LRRAILLGFAFPAAHLDIGVFEGQGLSRAGNANKISGL